MAKIVKPKGGLTVVKNKPLVAATLDDMMEADAGLGVSTAREDNITPMMAILQPLSPQVNKQSSAFIKGAHPGMIWLKGAADELRDGEEGILFQPVRFESAWVEWIPRDSGGGFVTSHKKCPEDVIEKKERNRQRPRIMTKSGHEIIFTRYWAGYVVEDSEAEDVLPYVIPFASTGHTVFRRWMGIINNHKTKKGAIAGAFYHVYKLPVKQRTNPSGTWYEFAPEDAFPISSIAAIKRAKQLYEDLGTGAMQMEQPQTMDHVAADGGDNGDDDPL
jgi:hypothetical protein